MRATRKLLVIDQMGLNLDNMASSDIVLIHVDIPVTLGMLGLTT
jgi:hypothetical protein